MGDHADDARDEEERWADLWQAHRHGRCDGPIGKFSYRQNEIYCPFCDPNFVPLFQHQAPGLNLPEKKEIVEPIDGWEEDTYYIVDVAFSKSNPIHRKIYYSGFIKYGYPQAYNCFFTSDEVLRIDDVYYMKVLKKIVGMSGCP